MRRLRYFIILIIGVLGCIVLTQQSLPAQSLLTRRSPEVVQAESIGLNYLKQNLQTYGIERREDLQVKNTSFDRLAMAHVRVQQRWHGIPVFGGEGIVHLNRDRSVFDVTDNFVRGLRLDLKQRRWTAKQATDVAIAAYGCRDCLTAAPQTDLWILHRGDQDYLAYRVNLRREDDSEQTALPIYFVDAHAGTVIWHYNNLQTGTGVSLYSGTLPINTFASGGTYYLEDHTRDTATYDSQNSRLSFRTQRFTDTDDFWDSSRQYAAIDAQYGVNQTYDYFKTIHNRVGIDGQGGPKPSTSIDGTTSLITSRVHYGKRYNNAFWNGQQMTYGDGDGQLFSPLTSLDIAGHEMTHGVTEFTANLVYADESGALNESISDVFGALVERYSKGESSNTWKIGEDVYNPSVPGDALRYMDNPHAANDNGYTANDDPDHYSERYQGSQDNGGVHVNSGIANYVFYLLAQGGTHHLGGSMSGIGADAAGDIWYTALTNYMTSSTNFQQARQATITAASALYGVSSAQANAVAQAWSLCGVS